MMRANPLVTEVLGGITRPGKAQLDWLGLLVAQAAVLFLWWPKNGVALTLESQHGPHTLSAIVIAVGVALAYYALRAGAEETMLPGQHGLRDWALATPLAPGRVLRGYLAGQVIQSVHLVALSSPLIFMAFTVSGGEWPALAWCLAAALLQALFYRLCGAITHLTIGQHRSESYFAVRAFLLIVYVPIGWLAPATSHVALTTHALGESAADPLVNQAGLIPLADHTVFLATYAGLTLLAAFVVHRLLLRARGGAPGPGRRAGLGEAAAG
jgi:hypothetical protein